MVAGERAITWHSSRAITTGFSLSGEVWVEGDEDGTWQARGGNATGVSGREPQPSSGRGPSQ